MATGTDYEWARSPSLPTAPDTTSPIYPDRPIRPLPKTSIKARLSAEQADSITYPPVPQSSSPLFSPVSGQGQRANPYSYYASDTQLSHYEHIDHGLSADVDSCASEVGSDEYLDDRSLSGHRNSWPGRMMRYPSKLGAVHSAASSVDGYESIENNNKKKRKIPIIPGSVPADVAQNDATSNGAVGSYDEVLQTDGAAEYANSGSGVGVSGAGRGRGPKPAKVMRERHPLGNSTNNQSNSAAVPNQGEPPKIISEAMKSAKAMKPMPPAKGQENVSVLQQQQQYSQLKPAAKSHKFDFTWPSSTSNLMTKPPDLPKPGTIHGSARGVATQGTQTSPGRVTGSAQSQQPQQSAGAQDPRHGSSVHPATVDSKAQQPQQPQPPPKRRLAYEYKQAARARREQQRYNNYNHPPLREDVWICEFCEFESIFGKPPRALIRHYEERDYKKREEAEHRRRLLEKAKAKGRKNKKAAKGQNKSATTESAPDDPSQPQRYDQYDNPPQDADEGDEFYDDGYDDGPLQGDEYAEDYDDGWQPHPSVATPAGLAPPPQIPPGRAASRSV